MILLIFIMIFLLLSFTLIKLYFMSQFKYNVVFIVNFDEILFYIKLMIVSLH